MKQFTLSAEGKIFFQPDPSNPLPGEHIGKIKKGAALLQPEAEVGSAAVPAEKVQEWLRFYIAEVLASLVSLKDEEQISAPAREIADKVYEAFGILPRAALEDSIVQLDEEGRAALRARKIRLGPVLIFMPLLNKPAAIKLRALLWDLWHDKPLPAAVPPDGVTSLSVADQEALDPVYYRAIGYPVYGPRAVRVDMLDRLISAVYDSADKGVFKARHEMAEWLGCPIPDLYAVLEAMDHKKIYDPAEDAAQAQEQAQEQEQEGQPAAAEKSVLENEKEPEENSGTAPAVQEKPELATFRLRRGKAYGKPPQNKQDQKPQQRNRPRKPKQRPREQEKPQRVMTAAPKKKAEDSPFAVLKEMKIQNKE